MNGTVLVLIFLPLTPESKNQCCWFTAGLLTCSRI